MACFLCQNNEGILAMLDDECLRPGKVTDLTFLAKLNVECCKHPHYESRGCRKTQSDKSLPHDAFKLIHYAGAVSRLSLRNMTVPAPRFYFSFAMTFL